MPDPASDGGRSAGIWPPEALLGEEMLEATLDLLIRLASHTFDGADGISVSLLSREPGRFHTPSATSADLRELDAVQYETDQGPCVEAARTGEPVNVVIRSEERRWPEFARQSAKRGLRSVLSVPLHDRERVIGALNLYSERSQVFAEPDRDTVCRFACHAAVALKHASEFMTRDWIDEKLEEALSRADLIGQAKGILMAKGYSPDEASDSLRRASDRSNRTLSEVAQDIVASSRRGRSP